MDVLDLNAEQCIRLIDALVTVLNARKHTRIHMGEEIIVAGSLSKALNLPTLHKQLTRFAQGNFQPYRQRLDDIWCSLSQTTQANVLRQLDWYDVNAVTWDDPRSNRKPKI